MKNKPLHVTINGRIDIHDPEYYNDHSARVTATLRSPDGATNFRHVTVIVLNGEDPTEKVLAAFGALLKEEVLVEETTKSLLLKGLVAKTSAPAPAPKPKKVAIKKSVAKK